MYIGRNSQEIIVHYNTSEEKINKNDKLVEIKVNSKREDFENSDTTIFDKIDTNKDKIISYDELDVFVTDIKKKYDKKEAMKEYVEKEKSKGETAFGAGFFTGLGLVFAGGAILAGTIGKYKGIDIGNYLNKFAKSPTAKKVILNTCKAVGAGIAGLGGGILADSFFGFPIGFLFGSAAQDIFGNNKSDNELKSKFEKQYVEKEPDKSQEWSFCY